MHRPSLVAATLCFASSAFAGTLQVGPGKTYAKPCAAIAAAQDGDVIEIDAAGNGSYDGDVCIWPKKNRLTIKGVNGRAKIDAAGKNAGGKAIWVITGADTTVEDVELTGCKVPDKNGAGIRQEGANLTVRRCLFRANENGILTGANASSEILIEDSEFASNGAGDGYSHNMYIGHVGKFTLKGCYTHHAKVGHNVKSRAAVNHILYNRIEDGADGTASYELDLPNGGTSYVIGNVIQQGPATQNPTLLAFREEGGATENPGLDLYVVNNTFVDQRKPAGLFIRVNSTTAAVIKNNVFYGGGKVTDQTNAVLANNETGADPKFVDLATLDVRLAAGSPCINAGTDPGSANGFSLMPSLHYAATAHTEPRPLDGTLDLGAFEFGPGAPVDAGTPGPDAAGASLDASAAGPDATSVVPGDAAAVGADASVATLDSGSTAGVDGATLAADAGAALPDVESGCGCGAGHSRGVASVGFLMVFLLAAANRRRVAR